MKEHYVYLYLREDGTPYYVGKGKKNRIHDDNHKISLPPLERRVIHTSGLSDEESKLLEIELIARYGRKDLGTGILRNQTHGGDGGDTSHTPGFKAACEKRKGKPAWNSGKTNIYSKETLKKIGANSGKARKGKKRGKYNLSKPPAAAEPVTIGNTTFKTLKEAKEVTGLGIRVLRKLKDNPEYIPKKLADRDTIKKFMQPQPFQEQFLPRSP